VGLQSICGILDPDSGRRLRATNFMNVKMNTENITNPITSDASKKNYTVAVYYWPNFHRDPYHQLKKGEDWTEWQILKDALPKFEGHYQPKVPLWGYRDESYHLA
jgi:hypothetical protein